MLNSVDLVDLGQTLCLLRNPGVTSADTIVNEIRSLRRLLESLSLSRSLVTAQPLFDIRSIPTFVDTGRPSATAIAELKAYAQPIVAAVYAEVSELRVERSSFHHGALELANVAGVLQLNATQSELLNEALMSYRAGSFRSCMVMTWNSVYDFLRQWVFDHRQADFNNALTTHYLNRNGSPIYDPITDYQDFMTGKPAERTVIDTWYTASIIGERLRDDLRQCLRRRNDCAHSTLKVPDQTQAGAFARDLLDVARSQPFA